MKQNRWFPAIYMFLVTAFFSSIVIGFARYSSDRIEANEKLALEKAVLMVLPGLYDEKLSRLELHKRFVEKVTAPDESSAGAYTLKQNGKTLAYALPIEGQGFWAPIKGIIGLEADAKTVTGIAFYQQNETPGLGAEIAQPEFREQFRDKVISLSGKPLNIKRPGAALGPSDVHAVTGATQTSTRLEKFLNDDIEQWRAKLSRQGI